MATDSELANLAQSAVDQDQYGHPIPPQSGPPLGLDLSAYNTPEQSGGPAPDAVPAVSALDNQEQFAQAAPNGPVSEGPTEMPGDRDMSSVAPVQSAPVASGPTGQDTTVTPEGAVRNLGTARDAAMDVADAKAAEGPAKSVQLEANAESQSELARAARDRAVEIQIEQQAQKDGIAAAQAKASSAMDEFKQFKFRDFWADKSSGERVLANISVALGAFNADNTGGKNIQLDRINTIIDQQHKADLAKVRQREVFAGWIKDGVTDLAARYRDEMSTLKFKHAALSDAAAEEAKAQLIRNGIPVEEAENNTLVKGLRAKAQSEYAKGYSDEVKNKAQLAMQKAHLDLSRAQLQLAANNQNAPTPLNEGQSKSYATADQMRETEAETKNLGPLSAKGAKILREQLAIEEAAEKIPGYKAAGIGLGQWQTIEQALAKSGDPADVQRFVADQRFATIKLRGDSGASIAPSEYSKHMRDFTPQVGDTPATLASKAKARDAVVRGYAIRSGKPEDFGYAQIGGVAKHPVAAPAPAKAATPGKAAPAASAPSGIPDGTTGKAKDGTPVVRRNGKWVAE